MFSIDIYELIEQDAIVAFDDVVQTDAEKAWLDSFYPAPDGERSYGGQDPGAFRSSAPPIVMYYNQNAFRAAGLDPRKPPATWDELVAMGKRLTKADGSQWGVMIPSTGYPYWMFGALAMQNGQVLMNGEGNTTYFDDPAVIKALEFWKDLGEKHKAMPRGTIEWGTLRQNFLEGKTAIMWHSTGNLTAVKENAKFDFGVAMLPASKRRGHPHRRRQFLHLQKKPPRKNAARALRLIQFMTSPERSAEWVHEDRIHGDQPGCL